MTPMKAIRAKCLDCCCESAKEVRLCNAVKRPLYAYRFGHRPKVDNLSGDGDTEEKSEDSPCFFEEEREE